jgi:hypothetical protein
MDCRRLLAVPAVVAVLLGLAACTPQPGDPDATPTASATQDLRLIDAAEAEELMRTALPVAPSDFDVYNLAGLGEETFGTGWSETDHDALRVARVLRGAESPGWADFSRGPGYLTVTELLLMESDDAAGLTFNALASALADAYTIEADDGSMKDDFAPFAEPSGRWPFGTLEQKIDRTWATGERASGWIIYHLAGPLILKTSGLAVPGNDSAAALASYADTTAPELTAAMDALIGRIAALG